jgi:hypothetical protein
MATAPSRPGYNSLASDRELIALAKTMDVAAISRKTGRTPKAILHKAKRLGVSLKLADRRKE